MYYEERIINGVMHYRTHPGDHFKPFDIGELTRRYAALKAELRALTETEAK